jgi:hypothetical protein
MGSHISGDPNLRILSENYGIRFFQVDLDLMKKRGFNISEFTRAVVHSALWQFRSHNIKIILFQGPGPKKEKGAAPPPFSLDRAECQDKTQGPGAPGPLEPPRSPQVQGRGQEPEPERVRGPAPLSIEQARQFSEFTYLI